MFAFRPHFRAVLGAAGIVLFTAAGAPSVLAGGAGAPVTNTFVNELVVPGIESATTLAFLPGGSMLVGELTERIWIVRPGASAPDPEPFWEIENAFLWGEQGLYDMVLDPNFANNGYFYLFYTKTDSRYDNTNVVSRFRAVNGRTDLASEVVLWRDNYPAFSSHHGGAIAIGADGKLYFTYGDQIVDAQEAQALFSYRGKVLRINRDGSIPTDNPFYDGPGSNLDEIWAVGLRNPFRMSVDPLTGRMLVGDVGGNDASVGWEELNEVVAGANFGWPLCEGDCGEPGTLGPLYGYPHDERDACIVAGVFYRGTQFPQEYRGNYFFADYVQNWIRRLTFDAEGNVSGVHPFIPLDGTPDTPIGEPVKLAVGPEGALYYVDIGFNEAYVPNEATIRRIRYTGGNLPPVAVAAASPLSGSPPLTVSFSSAGSSDPEGGHLTYGWTFGDEGFSDAANPTYTYTNIGRFQARLTVSDGVSYNVSQALAIVTGTPPLATILFPASGQKFRAGDTIPFAGEARAANGAPLPASAFTWTILFRHEGHIHPDGVLSNVQSGALQVPVSGHDFNGDTRYEIVLSVRDGDGLTHSTSVTVFPDKVDLSFGSSPAGLELSIDGIRRTTPFVLRDVIGFRHEVGAPEQMLGGTPYYFQAWSDGAPRNRTLIVPTTAQAYEAGYSTQLPRPVIRSARRVEGGLEIQFDSLAGRPYRLESKGGLGPNPWEKVADFTGTGAVIVHVDRPSTGQRFYRVVLLPDGG